ncbi:MAG: peptide chain release factor N(5)-glutamine methyltransferase [Nannocystales bacterium]
MSKPEDRASVSQPGGSRPSSGQGESAPARDPIWTVRELMTWTQDRFTKAGIDGARTDVEYLLSAAMGCDRMSLYVRHDDAVSAEAKTIFRGWVKRRLAREPVAYLLGRRGFHALDLELEVDNRVLVPRPDTEHLVDWLLEEFPESASEGARVLDVGTGSGAVALAIAKARPKAKVTACDVSDDALALAAKNASTAALEVDFLRSDLLADVPKPEGGWAAIASNLPYIPSGELDALQPEVARWEPRLALDGGPDGLDLIRKLVTAATEALAPGAGLYLELGHDQSEAVQALMRDAGFVGVAARKDYGQIERVVRGHRPQ